MNAHEFARKLLELPEDTIIVYLEDGKPFSTTVKSISVCPNKTETHSNEEVEERLKRGQKIIPSTYVILNDE